MINNILGGIPDSFNNHQFTRVDIFYSKLIGIDTN